MDNADPVNKNIYTLKDKCLSIVCEIFDHQENMPYLLKGSFFTFHVGKLFLTEEMK